MAKKQKTIGQTITMDVPFLIKLMEWAREDAKTDQEIHFAVENMILLGGKVLTMEDFDRIFPQIIGGRLFFSRFD